MKHLLLQSPVKALGKLVRLCSKRTNKFSLKDKLTFARFNVTIKTALAITAMVLVMVLPLNVMAFTESVAQIRSQLHHPIPGGVAVVPVMPIQDVDAAPVVKLGKQRVLTLKGPKQWWAVVGIALDHPPGVLMLEVSTRQLTKRVPVRIKPHEYKSQHITLKNKAMVSPPPQTLVRIESELEQQLQAYATFSDALPSNLIFDAPVKGRQSSPFGLKRYFNGKPRNPHSGLDFAVPTGTPVQTPADGRILLIGDLYFNGLTVFVDHGQGVISMFCHLSEIQHLPGDTVKRGDVVGAVGSTGRSTGAHLHWNVSMNGVRVNPALFLRNK